MQATWGHVILVWGILLGGLLVLVVRELCKSPEQRKAEAEQARKGFEKHRAEEKTRRQQQKEEAPAKGLLESSFELLVACSLLMAAVVITVMIIVAATM